MSQAAGHSPLFFERYEIKYLIPESLVEPISQYVSTYCDLDFYSEKSLKEGGDGFYSITNLYLDSPNHAFLKHKLAGLDHGVNLRIRSYGDQGARPYYLEVKYGRNEIKKKFRSRLDDADWAKFLSHDRLLTELPAKDANERSNRDLFFRLLWSYGAEPKILTQYRRRAFASHINQYARVTFDRDLRYQARDHYDLVPQNGKMVCYDYEPFFDPGTNVILELKSITQVPLWFLDMIRYFGLEEAGFSKFAAGMAEVLQYEYTPNPLRESPLAGFARL